MKVVQEEIFGPVVTAIPFRDPAELVKQANNSVYGLAAGIWTRDIQKAHRLASQLRAGTVWINCYNIFDAALPFGGYKQSGWGREMATKFWSSTPKSKRFARRCKQFSRYYEGRWGRPSSISTHLTLWSHCHRLPRCVSFKKQQRLACKQQCPAGWTARKRKLSAARSEAAPKTHRHHYGRQRSMGAAAPPCPASPDTAPEYRPCAPRLKPRPTSVFRADALCFF